MPENTSSPSQKGRIFISYRRIDSAGYAGRIYDRLVVNFGEDAIFMDVDTIEGGTDFIRVLEDAVQSCDVLIALIGRQWLSIKDKDGKRRLDSPEDFVRIEIATALKRNIRVIPVLVDGVDMAQPTELPENLKALARRNALQVNHHSFNPDVYRLIEHTKSALDEAEELRVVKAQALQVAREKAAREKAEQQAAKDKAEKDAKEKAEREAVEMAAQEKARLEAEEQTRQKAAKEKAEREAVEKVTREKAEKETAEKVAREKEEFDLTEKVKLEKAEYNAARNAATRKFLSDAIPFFRIIGILVGIITLFWIGSWAVSKFISLAPMSTVTATQYPITRTASTNSPIVPTNTSLLPQTLIPTLVPRNLKIVFVSDRDGKGGIYIMDSDGGNMSLLISNPAYEWDPTWLPDGKRIAFASDRDDPQPYGCANINLYTCNFEIYVMDAKGDNAVRLTNNPAYDGKPDWSPDGKQIVFISNRNGKSSVNFGIYLMNADGTNVSLIKSGADFGAGPVWSPDGKQIAYAIYNNGNSEIYVMNANGSSQVNLTNNSSYDWSPTWSPDGKYIAFASNRADLNPATCGNGSSGLEACNIEIYKMNVDGSNVTRLTNNVASDESPTWSPDGKQIAFVSRRNGKPQIYVMNIDGSNQTNLINNSAGGAAPKWSPLP